MANKPMWITPEVDGQRDIKYGSDHSSLDAPTEWMERKVRDAAAAPSFQDGKINETTQAVETSSGPDGSGEVTQEKAEQNVADLAESENLSAEQQYFADGAIKITAVEPKLYADGYKTEFFGNSTATSSSSGVDAMNRVLTELSQEAGDPKISSEPGAASAESSLDGLGMWIKKSGKNIRYFDDWA